MLSDVQVENITAMFHALDATGDALLTRDDVIVRADQMCAVLAPEDGSQAHQDIQSAYRQAWDELLRFADANADGAVTLEEYLDAVDRGMLEDPQYVASAMLVVSHALFHAADANDDGVISLDEYVSMFEAIDLGRDLATAGFESIDRDGDGAITHDEFIDALREVFTTTDASSPGSHVLRQD
jgi:Ca2+-binding EF-hand superfamily protein